MTAFTDAQVSAIRTAGLTDTEWARRLRTTVHTVRSARVGITYQHIATPPDLVPRRGTGVRKPGKASMANRRIRRSYYRDC